MASPKELTETVMNRLLDVFSQFDDDLLEGGIVSVKLLSGKVLTKPCDCFLKHSRQVRLKVKELIPMDKAHLDVYSDILSWLTAHKDDWPPEAIKKNGVKFYQGLTPDLRTFRKRLTGSEVI